MILLGNKSMLVLLTTINFFVYVDRGTMSVVIYLLVDNEKGLGLSDWQAGLAASLFMLGFMIFSPFFAHYSQYYHPYALMSLGLGIMACAFLLTGLATNLLLLCAARALTGAGEAAF
jgi:MFS family permease